MLENVPPSRFHATNDLIGRYTRPDAVVVEIGSSDASFRQFHAHGRWTTVDKYGAPDVHADLDGAGVRMPFDDASTDLVICTEVLEHLRMGSALVADMRRILKESGTAVISVPNIVSLKSRLKVAAGRMPNLAASGDCGIPLGGTGALVDGAWVGGHVVDFNLARLDAYLRRGGLAITRRHKVPIEVPLGSSGRSLTLPAWMSPVTMGDFLLVAAQPIAVPGR